MVTILHDLLINISETILRKEGYKFVQKEEEFATGIHTDLVMKKDNLNILLEVQSNGQVKTDKYVKGCYMLTIDARNYNLDMVVGHLYDCLYHDITNQIETLKYSDRKVKHLNQQEINDRRRDSNRKYSKSVYDAKKRHRKEMKDKEYYKGYGE